MQEPDGVSARILAFDDGYTCVEKVLVFNKFIMYEYIKVKSKKEGIDYLVKNNLIKETNA